VKVLDNQINWLEVRTAAASDLPAIQSLAAHTWRTYLYLPLEELGGWLGVAPFFVAQAPGRLAGFLLLAERWPGLALIMAVSIDDTWSAEPVLDVLLSPALAALRARRVKALAYVGRAAWLAGALQQRGFRIHERVITFEKSDDSLPPPGPWAGHIYRARHQDLPALVDIDAAVFPPLWRNSFSSLADELARAAYFTVTRVDDRPVGYQFSHVDGQHGHVSRLAVHPDFQRQGIGAELLGMAIRALWARGARRITLNTQEDNYASQRLYRRFGFRPTGDIAPILWLDLENGVR
jgi:ribosomal-protein-alanine N-acetyltransferase